MSDSKRALIFTGAGIGVPLGLPTSTEFGDDVAAGGIQVTQAAIDFLPGDSAKDIERLLATLESFQAEPSFIENILPRLASGLAPQAAPALQHIQQRLGGFKTEARNEIKRIKKLIFQKLCRYDHAKAAIFYRGLFSELTSLYPTAAFSIVTTNYDLTLETTLEEEGEAAWNEFRIQNFDFGFSTNKFGRPIYDPARDFGWKFGDLEFLKIHGSLDWHRDGKNQCSRALSGTIPDNPDQMAILYPGFKGVPEVEPFKSLHGRLAMRLAQADLVLVLGFAFRDAYINSIFENVLRTRRELQMYYLNPLAIESHPKESMAPRFVGEFENFKHVKRGVEASDKPIDLASFLTPVAK